MARSAVDAPVTMLRVYCSWPGRVGDDEAPPRRREVAVGDVDRDALLALGAQAVGQQREVDGALAVHGVNVSVDIVPAAQTSAAEEIQRRTEKSELLVMGAYGQSRFRELVFGGVTRHLLRNMTIPVLFSH